MNYADIITILEWEDKCDKEKKRMNTEYENKYFNEKEELYDELEHYLDKHSVGELLRTVASVVGKKVAKMEMKEDKEIDNETDN